MHKDKLIIIYTPESEIRHPGKFIKNMWSDIKNSRELAWRLFIRNISAMYRQTILGYLWAFLPPIFITLTFVFLNSNKVLSVGATRIPYPVYVMIGTLLWQVFIDSIHAPLKLVSSSKAMLAKVNFPKEALIIAGLWEVLFNFIIRLVLLIIVLVAYDINVTWLIFIAPIGIVMLILQGLMIGILLTPLGILYQDVERGIAILTSIWFFITPIVYPPPSTWPASLFANLNPVSPILLTTREWITGGQFLISQSFMFVSIITLLLFFLGWILYRIAMPHIISRLGA